MICDLIHAKTKAAQKAAMQSLQGCFKREVTSVYERVIAFRVQVEAAIDFVEEAVDFIARSRISPELKVIQDEMQQLIASATKAVSYREGVTVMLLGPENVGKSTLHNYLCQAQKTISA